MTAKVDTHPDARAIRSCIRCGICCEKGGPAFHTDDKHLIQEGHIPLKDLYTIRKGEPVYDNVKDFVFPAPSDIIKIKRRSNASACRFYEEETRSCTIYIHRPLECRILECWNTRDIEKQYTVNRLTRADLLVNMKDIWELVSDHQERCDYARINRHLGKAPLKSVPPEVQEMVRYEIHFRRLLAQKGGIDPDLMDFLFGKPLQETLERYGIRVKIE